MLNSTVAWLSLLVVILLALLYTCYKSNKPLREKVREEEEIRARVEEMKRRDEAQRVQHEENRRDFLGFLVDVIQNPTSLRGKRCRNMASIGNFRHTAYDPIIEFFENITMMRTRYTDTQHLSVTVRKQKERITELEAQVWEIQKALQLGQPVEPKL